MYSTFQHRNGGELKLWDRGNNPCDRGNNPWDRGNNPWIVGKILGTLGITHWSMGIINTEIS